MREMGLLSIALKRPCINFSALLEGGGRGRHYPAYFSLKIQKREAKLIFGGQWEKCFCVVAIFCEKDALWKLKWKWTCGLYFLLWFFPASQEEFVWERLPIWNSRKCVRGRREPPFLFYMDWLGGKRYCEHIICPWGVFVSSKLWKGEINTKSIFFDNW